MHQFDENDADVIQSPSPVVEGNTSSIGAGGIDSVRTAVNVSVSRYVGRYCTVLYILKTLCHIFIELLVFENPD